MFHLMTLKESQTNDEYITHRHATSLVAIFQRLTKQGWIDLYTRIQRIGILDCLYWDLNPPTEPLRPLFGGNEVEFSGKKTSV